MRFFLGRLLVTLLALALLAVVAAAAWLGWANFKRSQRERQTVEALAPATGRWVDAGDARLFLQEWGPAEGPVVVLTHGTGAWSGTWFELPQVLADAGWHVVAIDLPPFGMSSSLQPTARLDHSRPAQAQRLLRAIASLPVADVTLVGHSFGAGPALEATVLDRSHIRRLVLVDPALGLGPNGEPSRCTPLPLWARTLFGSRALRGTLVATSATYPPLTGHWLERFVHRREAVTEARVAAYQLPMSRFGFSAELGDWAYAFASADCEPAASLDPIRLGAWARGGPPVALLWGADDTITPPAQGRALARWLPGATLTLLPGVGHIPHIEDPKGFAAALLTAIGPAAEGGGPVPVAAPPKKKRGDRKERSGRPQQVAGAGAN